MSRELAQQRAQQTALLKEKLAQRRKERMKKLRKQQELEKAKVSFIFLLFLAAIDFIGTSC